MISELNNASSLQTNDLLPLARGNTTLKLRGAELSGLMVEIAKSQAAAPTQNMVMPAGTSIKTPSLSATTNLNVTANTTGPAVKITQTGTGAALYVEDAAGGDASPFVVDGSGHVGVGVKVPGTNTMHVSANDAGVAIRVTQAGSGLAFRVDDATNDSTPFVVDGVGHVGIGLPNPSRAFVIQGNEGTGSDAIIRAVQTAGTTSTSGPALLMQHKSGTTTGYAKSGDYLGVISARGFKTDADIDADGEGYATAGQIAFQATGNFNSKSTAHSDMRFHTALSGVAIERLRIKSSGNIGIGTTSPTGTLHAYASSAAPAIRITQKGSTGAALYVEDSGTGDTSPFVVDYQGHVGIGTATPAQELTVIGNISATGTIYGSNAGILDATHPVTVNVNDNREAALTIVQSGTANAVVIKDQAGTELTPFVIDNAGNVVVGALSALKNYDGTVLQHQVVKAGSGVSTHAGMWNFSSTPSNCGVFSFNKSFSNTIGASGILPVYSGNNANIGSLHFSYYNGSGIMHRAAVIQAEAVGLSSATSTPGQLLFGTTLSGQTDTTVRMIINHEGKVGIGESETTMGLYPQRLQVNTDALINGITFGNGRNNSNYNTAVGYKALSCTADDDTQNTAVGYYAMASLSSDGLSSSYANVAVGDSALRYGTTGVWNNVALGHYALANTLSGANDNVAVGRFALRGQSLAVNFNGSGNIAVGTNAMLSATTAVKNVTLGYSSGDSITTGSKNVLLGYNADSSSPGAYNQIAIGCDADSIGDNSVVIGNSETTKTRLKGSVGIGTDNPTQELHVVGDVLANNFISNYNYVLPADGPIISVNETGFFGTSVLLSANKTYELEYNTYVQNTTTADNATLIFRLSSTSGQPGNTAQFESVRCMYSQDRGSTLAPTFNTYSYGNLAAGSSYEIGLSDTIYRSSTVGASLKILLTVGSINILTSLTLSANGSGFVPRAGSYRKVTQFSQA